MDKQDENRLRSFERKVLRKIFGPVLENGCWRRRKTSEIYELCDEPDDMKFIKLGGLRWAGHGVRVDKK